MAVVDANVLLRHLVLDHAEHSPRAFAFLALVETGERSVFLPESVIAEVVYVLSSKALYNRPRSEIRDKLISIIGMPGARTTDRGVLIDALELYATQPRLDFVDCLCAAHAEHSGDPTVYSFDRGFRNVPEVTWIEP